MIEEETLEYWESSYKNDAAGNNEIHRKFTKKVGEYDFLRKHRDHIELNKLGFGDRAFHYMWLMIIEDLYKKSEAPKALEIGVFKGQVISLWALIARQSQRSINITGVSPFEGNISQPAKSLWGKLRSKLSSSYRSEVEVGNLYNKEDYLQVINDLFRAFELDFESLNLIKGYSTDASIFQELPEEEFDVIYVDGDHSFEVVKKDLLNYTPKIKKGGYLITDDSSCNLPGGGEGIFWKGHQSVSDAVEIVPSLGFENILNIGHNRIFRKV